MWHTPQNECCGGQKCNPSSGSGTTLLHQSTPTKETLVIPGGTEAQDKGTHLTQLEHSPHPVTGWLAVVALMLTPSLLLQCPEGDVSRLQADLDL